MNLYGEVLLPADMLDVVERVEREGIGWIGDTPCVASWLVPYELPERIKIIGRADADCDVGPMRGSMRGVHARHDDGQTMHSGRYWMAERLGKRMGQMMRRRGVSVLSFRLNKRHFGIFGELPANVGDRWKSDFVHALEIELGGMERIREHSKRSVIVDGIEGKGLVVAYASGRDVYQAASELAGEFRQSMAADLLEASQ